ncbi:MAG: HD domain-containing phosphohydrolase [Myxococcota bacterium]
MPKLVVVRGPTAGLEYPVRGDILIGRDPRAQVIVAQREVSAQHARLTQVGERYFIEDLGSRNGTYLNTHPIQRHPVEDGDEIVVGRTAFRFDRSPQLLPPVEARQDLSAMTIDLDATRDVYALSGQLNPGSSPRMEHILKLLVDISRTVGALRGLKVTLDEIASQLLEVFPQCGRVIILLNRDGNSLEPVVTRWRGEAESSLSIYSETVVQRALTERRAILTIDALSDERFSASRSVMDLRLRGLMCAPLLHREQALGVVELDAVRHGQLFKEEDLALLTALVAQVSFAVANARIYDALQGVSMSTVSALLTALRQRSPTAATHVERVCRYALMLGRKLELSPEVLEQLRMAALLHDVALLGWPDSEPGFELAPWHSAALSAGLSAELRVRWSEHMQRTQDILAPARVLEPVGQLLKFRLERFDGQGLPEGRKGEQLPLEARILAVAEAFDALTAPDSPHKREGLEAVEALKGLAGMALDPALVQMLVQLWSARHRLENRRGTT